MQTHAQAAYLAGAIVCELEARGYAGRDGFSPAAMGNISRFVSKLPIYARHALPKAHNDPVIIALLADFDPPEQGTPSAEQSCFYIGYYHQKTARDLPKTFPLRLTALRESAGLSIPDLARRADISDDSIRLYEAGTRAPSWEMIQKIATALGVTTDTFRTG